MTLAVRSHRLTPVQRAVLEAMGSGWTLEKNPGYGRLHRETGKRHPNGEPVREFRKVRCDVVDRLWLAGYIETPRQAGTFHWILTEAGRAAIARSTDA